MLDIKFLCRFARHLKRDFREELIHYKWNDWEFSEFQGEKFFSWNFGHSKENVRMSVDITLPTGWCKEDELRFARILAALA